MSQAPSLSLQHRELSALAARTLSSHWLPLAYGRVRMAHSGALMTVRRPAVGAASLGMLGVLKMVAEKMCNL